MARTMGRLTALKVKRAKAPGMYADGGGLYLQVTEGGASWIYRYMLNKRAREMGLGPLALFGLAEARAKALDARRLRHEGIDPIEARHAERDQGAARCGQGNHVQAMRRSYIKAHRAGWRNDKHAAQWEATLATYAEPVIGALPVQAIDTALVLKILEPIWTTKPETAGRLRGRIESILDWAKVRGYRAGRKPRALARPSRQAVAGALEGAQGRAPRRIALRRAAGLPGRVARAGGHCGPRARIYHPDGRQDGRDDLRAVERDRPARQDMDRSGRAHEGGEGASRSAVRSRARDPRRDAGAPASPMMGFVFPGGKTGKPLSNMAFLMLLRRMNRDDLTATASARRSRLGPASARVSRMRLWRRPWRTSSAARWSKPIGAATCSRSGGG